MAVKVLVVGGSGYLGQFLVQAFLKEQSYDVALTYNNREPTAAELATLSSSASSAADVAPKCAAFRVDISTGDGLADVEQKFGTPDVVVNCAAISTPKECEKDPARARSINASSPLVDWTIRLAPGGSGGNRPALFIQLSTDQVYDGSKSFYKEEDEAKPVNMYGCTKVEMEALVAAKCRAYAILRSSIILGPKTPLSLPKATPLQWMDSVLGSGQAVDFFEDEFRCPVYVHDIVEIVRVLMQKHMEATSQGPFLTSVLNMGGPDRLSRADMAHRLAVIKGYDLSLVKRVPAASVSRGVASPADISVDVTQLVSLLGVKLTNYDDVVRQVLL